MTIQKRNGVSYLTFDVFENAPLTAAVSCRDGGVSQGFFTSLNMGLHVGDDPSLVVENRKRFFDALGRRQQNTHQLQPGARDAYRNRGKRRLRTRSAFARYGHPGYGRTDYE